MWTVSAVGPGGPSVRPQCKERGLEGRGSARGEPGGDNAEGSALVGMSRCPDGCSSSPPLLQEHFQMANREAAASLEEAQKVQGRRRPVLAGSGSGVPVLGPCTPAATGSGRAGEDFGIWRPRWRDWAPAPPGDVPVPSSLPGRPLAGKGRGRRSSAGPWFPPSTPRPPVLGTPVAQAEPGTGRGGVQGRWPGAGVQMADGRWDMGSWGSAMCGGVYVCDRESDGSPFLQAAEAPGTDGGASRDSAQSSAQTASSKELLQRMVGVEGLPVRGGWGCRP